MMYMTLNDLIAFAVFFIVAGTAMYCAITKRIDVKLTTSLLAFSLFALLVIANYDVVQRWSWLGVEVVREEIQSEKDRALLDIEQEATRQKESIENLIQSAKEIGEKRNELAEDLNLMTQSTLDIARQSLVESSSFSAINAEVQWNSLIERYEEVDSRLREWEQSQNLERDAMVPESPEELAKALFALESSANVNLAPEVSKLYEKRFQKYESLKHVANLYKPFVGRFARIDFGLPSPPKIPSGSTLRGGSLSGGSIN